MNFEQFEQDKLEPSIMPAAKAPHSLPVMPSTAIAALCKTAPCAFAQGVFYQNSYVSGAAVKELKVATA